MTVKRYVRIAVVVLACVVLVTSLSMVSVAKQKVTLRFWTPLTTSADKDIHAKLIEAFQKENPDITVIAEYVSHKDWFTKWMTAIMSKDTPDLSLLDTVEASWLYYQNMAEPVEDIVNEIDPQHNDFVWGRADVPAFTTPDGHIWAIPYSININALWYRKDLLAKSGISGNDLKTWDDLYSAARRLSNPPDVYGIGMALARELGAQQQLFVWTNANGGNFFDPTTGAYLFGQSETRQKVKEALQWLKKLYDDQILPPGVGTWMWVDYRTAMAKGKLVFTASWGGDIGIARDQNPAMLNNLSVTAHPSGPSADAYPPYHDAGAWAWAITKTNDKVKLEAAKKWIRFVFRPENVALATTARPVYNLPTLRSVFASSVYTADPTTKQFLGEAEYLFNTVLPLARRVGLEAGPSPVAGQLQATLFPSDAVHYYLFQGWGIDQTLDWLDSKFRELFKEINYPIEGPYAKK